MEWKRLPGNSLVFIMASFHMIVTCYTRSFAQGNGLDLENAFLLNSSKKTIASKTTYVGDSFHVSLTSC